MSLSNPRAIPAMRGCTAIERVQQVGEPRTLRSVEVEDVFEHRLLQACASDPDGPTADLLTLRTRVVVLAADRGDGLGRKGGGVRRSGMSSRGRGR